MRPVPVVPVGLGQQRVPNVCKCLLPVFPRLAMGRRCRTQAPGNCDALSWGSSHFCVHLQGFGKVLGAEHTRKGPKAAGRPPAPVTVLPPLSRWYSDGKTAGLGLSSRGADAEAEFSGRGVYWAQHLCQVSEGSGPGRRVEPQSSPSRGVRPAVLQRSLARASSQALPPQ